MAAPSSQPLSERGRVWWLPPHGRGNGLDDGAWAPVLEVDEHVVEPLLLAFLSASVPAYAAPTGAAGLLAAARHGGEGRCGEGRARRGGWSRHRVWVGASAHGRAEQVLIAVMPELVKRLRLEDGQP